MFNWLKRTKEDAGEKPTQGDVQYIEDMTSDLEALAIRLRRMTQAAWHSYSDGKYSSPPPFDEYGSHMATAVEALETAKDILGAYFEESKE